MLGCTAAAGGLAFAGGDAMGAIQYFNTQVSVGWSAAAATNIYTVGWDINDNGNADGALEAGAVPGGFAGWIDVATAPPGLGSGEVFFAQTGVGLGFAAALPKDQSTWAVNTTLAGAAFAAFGSQGVFGSAFFNTTAYAGFAFSEPALTGSFFGWAKVRFDALSQTSVKITVSEWAYDDEGCPIAVGAPSGGGGCGTPVPTPATPLLTLLGLGALGMQAYRRRREQGPKRLAEEQDKAAA